MLSDVFVVALTLARRAACIAASIGLALAFALPAEARRVWPVVGVHAGDVTVTAQCRPGDILRGLTGRAGLWLDQVQLLCNAPNASNGDPAPQSDRYGGVGGAPFTVECANSERLYATKIDLTSDGKRIKNIIFYCMAASGDAFSRHQIAEVPGSDSKALDNCVSAPNGGGLVGCDTLTQAERKMAQQSCPNEVFVGMTVRFGADVNSIGFICDTVP